MAVSDYPASVPTAVVSIDVRDPLTPEADQPRDGSVSFTIRCDLRSPVSGTIIRAATRTVHLVDGLGEVTLPQYDTAAIPGDWWIEVSKSWLPSAYAIRVPAGKTAVNLAELDDINASARAARALQGISDVKIVYTDDGTSWSTFEGGVLSIGTPRPSGTPGPPLADKGLTMAMVSPQVDVAYRRGVSVLEYGAKGDGVTDDTAAINAAAQAAGMGGLVWFPAGGYVISGTVTVLQNQRWMGPAQVMDHANLAGATIMSIHAGVAVSAKPSSTLQDLQIIGPAGKPLAGSVGLESKAGSSITCERVTIRRYEVGVDVDSLWYGHFDRLMVSQCRTAFRSSNSYNVNFHSLRVACLAEDGVRGVGLALGTRSWVTLHGAAIEQYTVGIDLGFRAYLASYGLYQESAHPGCSGIKITSKTAALMVSGSQVYLTDHKAWIDTTAARPASLVSIGNYFSGGTAGAAEEYAYMGAGEMPRCVILGDSWTNTNPSGGQKYMNLDAPVSSMVFPPYGAPAFGARATLNGRPAITGHVQTDRSFVPGSGPSAARPAMLASQAGATWFDATLQKLIVWTGTRWTDMVGTAV